MAAVNDPVEQGFVSSLAHPGGNITGFAFVDFQMVGKWLDTQRGRPRISWCVMFYPDTSPDIMARCVLFASDPPSIAVEVTAAPVRDTAEIEEAIVKLGPEPAAG